MKKGKSEIIFIVIIAVLVIFGLYFTDFGSIYTGAYDIITNIEKINFVKGDPVNVRAQFVWDGASWDDPLLTAVGFYSIDGIMSQFQFPLLRVGTYGCLNNDRKGKNFILSDNIYTFTNLEPGEHEVKFYTVAGEVNDCESQESSRKIWFACYSESSTPEQLITCDPRIKVRATDTVRFNVIEKTTGQISTDPIIPVKESFLHAFLEWLKTLFR